jgi:phospholipid/cholesterol/gamma-HCH transport system substrate-binding protein
VNKEARVGLLFAVSLGLLAGSLMYIGNFQKTHEFIIEFFDINGLTKDSPVQFNGVPIGRVTGIRLKEAQVEGRSAVLPIQVTIAVERHALPHIRESTEASIRSVGLLGDKMIRLYTSDYSFSELAPGGVIRTGDQLLDMEKLIAQGKGVASDVGEIANQAQRLLEQLSSGDGVLQRLYQDEVLAEEVSDALHLTLTNLSNKQGLLALLVNDPVFAEEVRKDLIKSMGLLQQVMADLRDPKGTVSLLVHDEAFRREIEDLVTYVRETLAALVDELKQSRGFLHALLYDEERSERILSQLEKSSFHLANILEKIDRGEGTAGKLINETVLYDGISDIVYGVEHSGFSKWYLNRKRKKGESLKAKEAPTLETP